MLDKIKKFVTWPIAFVLVGGGLVFGAVAIWAPPEARELLLGANGFVCTVFGIAMRSPLTQGSNDNGDR